MSVGGSRQRHLPTFLCTERDTVAFYCMIILLLRVSFKSSIGLHEASCPSKRASTRTSLRAELGSCAVPKSPEVVNAYTVLRSWMGEMVSAISHSLCFLALGRLLATPRRRARGPRRRRRRRPDHLETRPNLISPSRRHPARTYYAWNATSWVLYPPRTHGTRGLHLKNCEGAPLQGLYTSTQKLVLRRKKIYISQLDAQSYIDSLRTNYREH